MPLDAVVTTSAVMKPGKIKQDNICFIKNIPNKQAHKKGESTALSVGCSVRRAAAGQGWLVPEPAVAARAENAAGRQAEVLCVPRSRYVKQSLPSQRGPQLQVLSSGWGTVFSIFTWNSEVKMPLQVTLHVPAFACKGTFSSCACLRPDTGRISFGISFPSGESAGDLQYQHVPRNHSEGKSLLCSGFFIFTVSETN